MSDILESWELIEADYIESLIDKKDIYDYRCFNGLLIKISIELKIRESNKYINDIYRWFLLYMHLSSKYKQKPNIVEFCTFICIHKSTFYSWLDNKRKNNMYSGDFCDALNMPRVDVLKMIQQTIEGITLKGAANNNIGDIFVSKALYHYSDAPQPQPINIIQLTAENPTDIAKKYGIVDKRNQKK